MIKNFSFLLFWISFTALWSQNTNISPYSYFSLGDNNQQITVASSAMGGISVAANRVYELNFSNPALLSQLQVTSFDISGRTQFMSITDAIQTQNSATTNFSYLAFGFPITKKMGLMFGIQPNTNVGYDIKQEIYDSSATLTEANHFYGTGGTNRFFIGTGYQVYKGLSLGVEGEILFGSINNSITNMRNGVMLNNRYNSDAQLSGGALKLGAAYQHKFAEEKELNIETSIKLSNKINATTEDIFYNFYYNTYATEVPVDTLYYHSDLKGKITRPLAMHMGLGYGSPEKWYVGVEYNKQAAWEFNQTPFDHTYTNNTDKSQLNFGGYYLPKKNSISSYWNRVIYRVGAKMENTGIAVQSNQNNNTFTEIKDFGISFGLGLPVGNQLSKLNLSVEWGKRGEKTGSLIQENYVNLRFGINLAEKWFQKNKIN